MNRRACPLVRLLHDCWREKCAWYLVRSKQCAIPLIASQLQRGRKSREEFDKKLPDEYKELAKLMRGDHKEFDKKLPDEYKELAK